MNVSLPRLAVHGCQNVLAAWKDDGVISNWGTQYNSKIQLVNDLIVLIKKNVQRTSIVHFSVHSGAGFFSLSCQHPMKNRRNRNEWERYFIGLHYIIQLVWHNFDWKDALSLSLSLFNQLFSTSSQSQRIRLIEFFSNEIMEIKFEDVQATHKLICRVQTALLLHSEIDLFMCQIDSIRAAPFNVTLMHLTNRKEC